jgi:hypothetical protein
MTAGPAADVSRPRRPRTRIPPARRYLSGHVVVAARVPLSKARPLPTKEGVILRTVGEAANYVLALPPERAEHRNRWRHAAKLLLDQADVADVSRQVHLALFYDAGAFLIVAVLVVVVVRPTLAPWL